MGKKKTTETFRNEYLEDIGIVPFLAEYKWTNDKRHKKWRKQREKYGFDDRETWNMDMSFCEWLYSHICMYESIACIDLNFHKFEIDGKTYTQGEAIKKMKKYLKYYLKHCEDVSLKEQDKAFRKLQKATRIWAEIMGAMWW